MSQLQKEDIHQAAAIVHRSPRTIRRWAAQGIDVRDTTNLRRFAKQVSHRAFGRYGNGARSMGKKGGSRTSDAKRQSSQANGKRGGRPKDGLLLLRKAIRDENWLDLRNAADDDLKVIWSALVKIDKQYLFWVGDILDEIEKRHENDSAGKVIKEDSPDPEKFRVAKIISQMFCQALGNRRFNLDWRHYREVVAECGKGNSKECVDWLEQAEVNQWSPSVMRAAIRRAHATDVRPIDRVRTMTLTTELRRLNSRVQDVLSARPVAEWTLEEINAFMQDADPFLKVADAVKRLY